jgi:hypothetical protein
MIFCSKKMDSELQLYFAENMKYLDNVEGRCKVILLGNIIRRCKVILLGNIIRRMFN